MFLLEIWGENANSSEFGKLAEAMKFDKLIHDGDPRFINQEYSTVIKHYTQAEKFGQVIISKTEGLERIGLGLLHTLKNTKSQANTVIKCYH